VYRETNPEQRKVYVDAVQTYQALEEARLQARHYSGYTARVPLHFGNSEHPKMKHQHSSLSSQNV
jgi:hypothetical protein